MGVARLLCPSSLPGRYHPIRTSSNLIRGTSPIRLFLPIFPTLSRIFLPYLCLTLPTTLSTIFLPYLPYLPYLPRTSPQ
jgi:hypothetical protein